jgi:2-isopropylmalate synthase
MPLVDLPDRTWPGKSIQRAPIWCSVDLRDGNQALVNPMNIEQKLEIFQLLVRLGFKEIEVAFPSASQIEFSFVRMLVEQKLIPEDVTIQVLTQAREHLIRRTFEAIDGAPNAIVHLYNSTSTLQRDVVFGMTQDEIACLAVDGTRLVKSLVSTVPATRVRFEYSPESFTGTELEFSLRVCEDVMQAWEPTPQDPIVLNLPATVEMQTPNVYADQIEWMCRHLKRRDCALISVHPHNDRGCAVAAAELGQMAGADRVEGTLFGYGERTGNVDIVTLALNLVAHGVDPNLALEDVAAIADTVVRCTENPIHIRHPYSGELVFTAFSGSHQDAINKGMRAVNKRTDGVWEVPYLLIDPKDIGRTYEAIIRVNSQSGKGGVAYILRTEYGIDLPKSMQPEFSNIIQDLAEQSGKELKPEDIMGAFRSTYLDARSPFDLVDFELSPSPPDLTECRTRIQSSGEEHLLTGTGNGSIDAFCNALKLSGAPNFEILSFSDHSIGYGTDSMAAAYVLIDMNGVQRYGAAMDTNASGASLRAVISALNRALA